MSKVKIEGHGTGTGTFTVTTPSSNTDRTITLPDSTGTLATTADSVGGANGVDFNDNVKARFGTGNDFAIWHDGSHTRFQNDTGNLNVRANVFNVTKSDDSENIILAEADGDVKLYRNNAIHLETLATGVRVPVGGVLFGTDTAAANALDDYEEGDWTPTLTNSGTISHRVGKYVKIGNQIMVQGEFRTTSYNNSGATDVKIGGLPYSSFNESHYNFAANLTPIAGFNSSANQGLVGYVSSNETNINLYGVNFSSGTNYDFLQTGEMGTTVEVFFAVHYRTN